MRPIGPASHALRVQDASRVHIPLCAPGAGHDPPPAGSVGMRRFNWRRSGHCGRFGAWFWRRLLWLGGRRAGAGGGGGSGGAGRCCAIRIGCSSGAKEGQQRGLVVPHIPLKCHLAACPFKAAGNERKDALTRQSISAPVWRARSARWRSKGRPV